MDWASDSDRPTKKVSEPTLMKNETQMEAPKQPATKNKKALVTVMGTKIANSTGPKSRSPRLTGRNCETAI